ncbi:MAG: TIR domain-containing protein [Clostridia bacterium]|nr:TIR domain-containing protein [Clostridia bacterium]
MEVFVSWTGADRDVKNAIVEKLNDAGIECWDSDEHCVSDFSEECIAAIKECEVFIVIISDSSMKKGYVKNEVITARGLEDDGKLNILVYKITDEPYTNGFEFRLNHISFENGNLVRRKESIMGQSSIDNIVKRTKVLLQKRKDGNPEKPFEVKVPQVKGLKITKSGYFVENSRDDILATFDNLLEENNVIILKELFGYGKKSTIRKFAELHKNKYNIIMVDNEASNLKGFFVSELEFENLNSKIFDNLEGDALIDAKFRQLEKLDSNTMIVVPNVKFESLPNDYICQRLVSLKCKMLFITQESAERYSEWFPVVNLGKMTDAHLKELFFHHYDYAIEEEQEALGPELESFFAGIGGHTKTVELTASVLARELCVYPEDVPQYLSLQGTDGMKLKDKIMSQISYLFSLNNLSETEITILLVASYTAVPRISEITFRKILEECGVNDWNIVMDLDKRRWLDIDIRNRSVSIEPIIAKIVTDKFPENYFIISKCFDSIFILLVNVIMSGATQSSQFRSLNKLRYFLSATGFPEAAHLMSLFAQYLSDMENFDRTQLKTALEAYEAKYNSVESSKDEYNLIEDEENSLDDETMLCDDSDDSEEYNYEYCLSTLKRYFSGIITSLKFISKDIDSTAILNFSKESHNIFSKNINQIQDVYNIEEFIGITKEELTELLQDLHESYEQIDELEKDDIEFAVLLEIMAFLDALYSRDSDVLMNSVLSILLLIDNDPSVLCGDIADSLIQIIRAVGIIYIKMSAYSSAIGMFEKILKYEISSQNKHIILINYIYALRSYGLYEEKLYNAYEELLDGFEKRVAELSEGRSDIYFEKKIILLQYAADLAYGEKNEEALKQFISAQKADSFSHPNEVVCVAKLIMDALINSGEFDKAVSFVSENFSNEYLEFLKRNVDEETLLKINDLEICINILSAEENPFFSKNNNEYIDYYYNYSRQNNSILEKKYYTVAEKAVTYDFSSLTDAQITEYTLSLKAKAKREKMLSLAPEAFALASEAGYRALGYKHHFVQYMGAAAMADGKVAEIMNGEGKTYTIVLVAFLNFIFDKKSFVVDSSEYLTKRNYEWMQGVYRLLGMSCGLADTNKYFITTEQNKNQPDVTYTSANKLTASYLSGEINIEYKNNFIKLDCAIIDEIDSVLVDDAELPHSIVYSKTDVNILPMCEIAYKIATSVAFDDEYYTYKSNHFVLKDKMISLIEKEYGVSYTNINSIEHIKEIEKVVHDALYWCNHSEKNKDYYISNGIPVRENKNRGVFEPLQAIPAFFVAKANNLQLYLDNISSELSKKSVTLNRICIRDMFKKFAKLCGTSATVVSFKKEFKEIYDLEYVAIPPFSPCIRKDYAAPFYTNSKAKDEAIISFVEEKYATGQPILIIAQSINESEKYSALLNQVGIPHKLLNAKNSNDSSDLIALAGEPGSVLVATYLVNRGADIKLGGSPELKTRRELVNMGIDITGLENLIYSVPGKEHEESDLYKKYYSILEKNKRLMLSARQEAIKSGGLCVIGTSFFAEPRTEQQTRGRSGRQGDVGESYVFKSAEDDTLRILYERNFAAGIMDKFRDVGELESTFLNKSIYNVQKKMHAQKFAKIRKNNGISLYIDKGRKLFIDKRFELANEEISIDDIIRDWASDENVHNRIKALQKGAKPILGNICDLIYPKYSEQLSSAKGKKLERALFSAIKAQMEGISDNLCANTMQGILIKVWSEYIELVCNTIANVEMTDRALDKHFENERQRLYIKCVELFIKKVFITG